MADTQHPAEMSLFEAAVADVAPLQQEVAEPYRQRRPPHPLPQPRYKEPDRPQTLSEAEVQTGDFLAFARPGVQKRLFQDLQRGHIPVELELDLHGLSASFAEELLERFLAH